MFSSPNFIPSRSRLKRYSIGSILESVVRRWS
jgi:hypothetical protein